MTAILTWYNRREWTGFRGRRNHMQRLPCCCLEFGRQQVRITIVKLLI